MAERDQHAAPREFGDALRRDAIGRERQHDRAAIGVGDRLDVVGRKVADVFEFMRAPAARVEEGPFQMDAECRRGPTPCLARRGDGGGHHLRRVGHERRQQADGTVFAMRGGDAGDALGCRVIVEQDAAAAIDLHVDIAGRKQAAAEIPRRAVRSLGVRDDCGDALAFDDDRVVVEKTFAVEDPRAGQNDHQTVSVTLRRLRGRSGSRPSRSASASARR